MAQYSPPNPYVPKTFNPANFITSSATITEKYLSENYLKFPFAQDTENFVSINNQGALNQGGRAEFSSATFPAIFTQPPTVTNPVVYPAVNPSAAVATIEYVNDAVMGGGGGGGDVYLNLANQFSNYNTFNPSALNGGDLTYPTGINLTNKVLTANDNDIVCVSANNTFNAFNLFTSSTGVLTNSSVPSIQISNNGGSMSLNSTSAINLKPSTGVYISNSTNNSVLQLDGTFQCTYGNIHTNIGDIYAVAGNIYATGGTLSAKSGTLTTAQTYDPLTTYTTGISSQAFVQSAVDFYAPLASPQITGVPTVPTAASGTNSTQIASTEFVQTAIASTGGGDVYAAGNNTFTGENNFDWNSGGITKNNGGLTLARNNITGSNEVDLISINSTTNVGMCLYAETTQVTGATDPKIIIYNDGTNTLFNTQIDTPLFYGIPTQQQLTNVGLVSRMMPQFDNTGFETNTAYYNFVGSQPNFDYMIWTPLVQSGGAYSRLTTTYTPAITLTLTSPLVNTLTIPFSYPIIYSTETTLISQIDNPAYFNVAGNIYFVGTSLQLYYDRIVLNVPTLQNLSPGQTIQIPLNSFYGNVFITP